jgi:NAD(P)-dependent dehydrogenase (short-subunit alcohol dehydrogenase family)
MGAEFDGKKVVVVGGSAGMGRQAALDVIDRGGSAVIIGRSKERVDDTVAELTNRRGQAWGIAAELTDRSAVPRFVRSGSALTAVRLLIEMLADDAAVRTAGPTPLARALVACASGRTPSGALAAGGPTTLLRVRRLGGGPTTAPSPPPPISPRQPCSSCRPWRWWCRG